MKLYYSPASPFVRKVVVLLNELDKTDHVTLQEIATTPHNTDEALMASNPLGKIPALERAEGTTLYDNRVICQYLNDKLDGGMYPQGGRRWETLTLEATGDGIMDCAVSMTYEVRMRPENERSAQWIEAQWAKIERAITVLNARWISHLHGPVDMGQISVACALSYLDFRHGPRDWRKGNTELADWHESFESRSSMQATLPPAG